MKLEIITCPSCGANLDCEDSLDTFYCKYCGNQIFLDELSDAAYDARVSVKYMEHEEKLQDKHYAHERFKIEASNKERKRETKLNALIIFIVLGLFLTAPLVFDHLHEIKQEKQNQQLQAIVAEIMVDIDNKDFDEARIKANSLHWKGEWTDEEVGQWNATRREILRQIKEAEKEAKKEEHKDDDVAWWQFWK